MGSFFSREEVEAAVAPTPQGDKMGPPESGYEEAETIAQLIGARRGLSPRALPAGAQSAAEREAQTLEAVLKLRTSHNQVSAWMEYVQRELGNVKGSVPPLEAALQEVRGPS